MYKIQESEPNLFFQTNLKLMILPFQKVFKFFINYLNHYDLNKKYIDDVGKIIMLS